MKKTVNALNIKAFQAVLDAKYVEVFNLIRTYIQHEDDLINQRTVWFLTLNSFLFATLGLLSTATDDQTIFSEREIRLFVCMIGSVGIAACFTTFLSVRAAYTAIKALKSLWVDKYEPEAIDFEGKETRSGDNVERHDPRMILPYIKGGGPYTRNAPLGRVASYGLQLVIAIAWAFTIFVAVSGIESL
jgi:hypothetical protein